MTAPIQVLLVDDKEDYCKSLSGSSRFHNIQIEYQLDWETGFERLRNNPKIEFVILDGKGKIEADQETEKDNFVIRAIIDIDKYSRKIKKHIPYCVNTGYMERFEALEGNVKIFEKTDAQRDFLFQFIQDEVNKSDYRTFRIEYPEPFLSFDKGIVPEKHKDLFLKVLKAYKQKDFKKTNLNLQRDFLEAIFKALNNPIPCIPAVLFYSNGLPNHEWCTRFMEERDANGMRFDKPIPQVIKSAFRKLKESTNGYSHLRDEDIVKIPFLVNTFLFMEILEWLPKFVDEHYKNFI